MTPQMIPKNTSTESVEQPVVPADKVRPHPILHRQTALTHLMNAFIAITIVQLDDYDDATSFLS